MLYFEQKSFDIKDWRLLLDAGARLMGMGMINEMSIKPFLVNLVQRLEGKATYQDETFLGYLRASSVATFLASRENTTVGRLELVKASGIGLVAFLVLSVILYKSIRVNDGARAVTEDMCMYLLADALFERVNSDRGDFFRCDELRSHTIACFDAFLLSGHLDFVEELFQVLGEKGAVFEVSRERLIFMFSFFISSSSESGSIR